MLTTFLLTTSTSKLKSKHKHAYSERWQPIRTVTERKRETCTNWNDQIDSRVLVEQTIITYLNLILSYINNSKNIQFVRLSVTTAECCICSSPSLSPKVHLSVSDCSKCPRLWHPNCFSLLVVDIIARELPIFPFPSPNYLLWSINWCALPILLVLCGGHFYCLPHNWHSLNKT